MYLLPLDISSAAFRYLPALIWPLLEFLGIGLSVYLLRRRSKQRG